MLRAIAPPAADAEEGLRRVPRLAPRPDGRIQCGDSRARLLRQHNPAHLDLLSLGSPVTGPVTALEPFRIANRYGLFAVMTRGRYEIEFQGSQDGQNWVDLSVPLQAAGSIEGPRHLRTLPAAASTGTCGSRRLVRGARIRL